MFIGSFPGTHDKENVQQHSLAGILALVAKLSTVGSLQPHTLTSFAPGLEPVCGNTMAWKADYYDPEGRHGKWQYVPYLPAVPVTQIANGERLEGRHSYTFGGGRLQQEKYRHYAACADGCVKCVMAYIQNNTGEFLNSVSNSDKYTAMDYVLFVHLEVGGLDRHRRVIDALKDANVAAKWYVYEGDTWKKRM